MSDRHGRGEGRRKEEGREGRGGQAGCGANPNLQRQSRMSSSQESKGLRIKIPKSKKITNFERLNSGMLKAQKLKSRKAQFLQRRKKKEQQDGLGLGFWEWDWLCHKATMKTSV